MQYKTYKVVYRRYAGLYFIFCVDVTDNELLYLETIHLFVEVRPTWVLPAAAVSMGNVHVHVLLNAEDGCKFCAPVPLFEDAAWRCLCCCA